MNEEIYCLKNFYSRNSNGRYIVQFHLKLNVKNQGNQNKRFHREPDLQENYCTFIHEYLDMEHMEKIPKGEIQKPVNEVYYLPFHLILKNLVQQSGLDMCFMGVRNYK